MNLTYEITLEDYLELYRSQSKYNFNRPWIRWILRPFIIGVAFISGIGGIWYGIAYYSDRMIYSISVLFLGLASAIALLFVFNPEFIAGLQYRGLKENHQKKPSLIGKRNISIHKNGLSLEAKNFDIFLNWRVFNYLSETDNLFVLYFYGKEYRLIPKRCFENYDEVGRFRELLQNKGENLEDIDDKTAIVKKLAENNLIFKLEYRLGPKDYLEARQTKNFPRKWVIWYYLIIFLIIFWSGFSSMWKGIYRTDLLGDRQSSEDAILNGFLISGFGFYLLLEQYPKINILQRRKIARNWNNNPEMQSAIKLMVTESKITLVTDYLRESIAWQEYIKLVENKEIFLLYYSENYYQIVPKKAFNCESEINQFKKLIQSHNKITKVSF